MAGEPEDYSWMPDGYSFHASDVEQGQAEDLDDVTNGEPEPEKPNTQRITLAGGGKSIEVQLEGIDAITALATTLEMWNRMGTQPQVPVGFAAEALHTERSQQDE